MEKKPKPIQSVSNTELYNRWAKVYDIDGNILQAVDDALLPALLTQALSVLTPTPITVTELGCGTGRNTLKLLQPSLSNVTIKKINALDLSPGMLSVARSRCDAVLAETTPNRAQVPPAIQFLEFDALNPSPSPQVHSLEGQADVVLSTLVLEHLPLTTFFQTVKSLLKPSGGVLVLTNMHAEMGRRSQAGFVDEETGVKVRGHSFNYEVGEVVEEGKRWGFNIVGEGMTEKGIEKDDIGGLVGPRGKKWVDCKVWFGCVMRFGYGSK